jgi:hypothetical protein
VSNAASVGVVVVDVPLLSGGRRLAPLVRCPWVGDNLLSKEETHPCARNRILSSCSINRLPMW